MSRRGLLPRAHRHVETWPITRYEIPFGKDVPTLLRWIRHLVQTCEERGGDWRSVIDGLRPYTQELWQRLPQRSRRRFLEHARAWWDVHRHRMAPEVEARIKSLVANERLTIVAARLCSVEASGGGAKITYRRRGAENIENIKVQKLIECRGLDNDPTQTRNPIIRTLVKEGFGRPDPLRISLEVTNDCAVIDVLGKPSERLFAIGPLTRAVFWEIIAVPDIRVQCAKLAELIVTRASQQDAA